MSPIVAVTCLYISTRVYGVEFSNSYVMLASLVVTLTAMLMSGERNTSISQLPHDTSALLLRIVLSWLIVVGILLAIGYLTKSSAIFSRRAILTWVSMTSVVLVVVGLLMRRLMQRLMFASTNLRKVAFAGCTELSFALAQRIKAHPELFMRVTGFFDDRSPERLDFADKVTILGKLSDLPWAVKEGGIDVLFVALPMRHIKRVMNLLDELRDTTVSIYYLPDVFVFDLIQARSDDIFGIPVVAMCETPFYGYRGVVKRITDIVVSGLLILFSSPLLLAIAVLVKVTSKGPIVFKQRRYGLDGEEIIVYKFRSMTVTEDGADVKQATKSDSRITQVGKFLRRYSLDELPQLFNVLQGHMSMVGPRPHAVSHNEQYRKLIKGYMVRHKVLPGITGLAQIKGFRGETVKLEDMESRVSYDLEYLRHWSPTLDFKILALTIVRLFWDEKAY